MYFSSVFWAARSLVTRSFKVSIISTARQGGGFGFSANFWPSSKAVGKMNWCCEAALPEYLRDEGYELQQFLSVWICSFLSIPGPSTPLIVGSAPGPVVWREGPFAGLQQFARSPASRRLPGPLLQSSASKRTIRI